MRAMPRRNERSSKVEAGGGIGVSAGESVKETEAATAVSLQVGKSVPWRAF